MNAAAAGLPPPQTRAPATLNRIMSDRTSTLRFETERRFIEAARFTQEFHVGESRVHDALTALTELKIASGMTAPHRLRDLADVIELIRVNALPYEFQSRLHPYVRERFLELWRAAQTAESG